MYNEKVLFAILSFGTLPLSQTVVIDSELGFCCSYRSDIVTLLLFAVLPFGTLPPSQTGVIVLLHYSV